MSKRRERMKKRAEAEHKKNKLAEKEKQNRISLILVAILLVVFGVSVFNVMRIESARRAELSQIAEANADESFKNKERGRQLHENIAQTIENDIGSVICLGDSFMGKVFPVSLNEVIQGEVIGNVNEDILSKANVYGIGRLQIPMFDESTKNETLNSILARNSLLPIRLAEDMVIPSGIEDIGISLVDNNGHELRFNTDIHLTLNGIEGTVSNVSGEGMVFARSAAGDAASLDAGTEVYADSIESFEGAVMVLMFGESYAEGADELVAANKSLIEGYHSDRYIVVGITQEGSELDQKMTSAFGDSYLRIDKSAYVAEEAAKQVFSVFSDRGYFASAKKAVEDAQVELSAMK